LIPIFSKLFSRKQIFGNRGAATAWRDADVGPDLSRPKGDPPRGAL
jgi:hypothetical protein